MQALEQVGLRTWPSGLPDGRIPEVVSTAAGPHSVEGYPALVVEPTGPGAPGGAGSSTQAASTQVSLRVLADRSAQATRHAAGVRELLLTELALPTGRVTSRWPSAQSLSLAASPYPTTQALVLDLQRAAVDALLTELLPDGPAGLRDGATYTRVRGVIRDGLEDRTFAVARVTADVLAAARELDTALRGAGSLALLATAADVRRGLDGLVHDGFVVQAGAARLPNLQRYLRAGAVRLAKAADDPQRDEGLAWQVREVQAELDAAVATARAASTSGVLPQALADVRWMIEELRVSLFAQQLGTAHPVSVKRVRTALAPWRSAA